MTNPICPQFSTTLLVPIGIENQSTRTMAHAYNSFGLSRDGSLPKAIHEGGAPDAVSTLHFIQYPAGNKINLSFDSNLLSKDRPSLRCFEAAIGFDRKHYEDKKDSVDQSTPLARFYQDQILEVWDPILEDKSKEKDSGPVVYKDLLKFWDNGIGDANTSTLNLATLQAILEHIENPNKFVTVEQLVADHDQGVSLALTKGGLVCGASDMGKMFNQSGKPEYNLACNKPDDANDALGALGYEDYRAVRKEELADANFYRNLSIPLGIGSGVGAVVLFFSIRSYLRNRKKKDDAKSVLPASPPLPPTAPGTPPPSPTPHAPAAARIEPAANPLAEFNDVIYGGSSNTGEVAPNVLEAMANDDEAAAVEEAAKDEAKATPPPLPTT